METNKLNDLNLHLLSLYSLCLILFAYNHTNYARYMPVYLMTLMNLHVSHSGSEQLLRNNGFSVRRSSVPLSRNAVDITIEQTINRHAKSQGGIIGLVLLWFITATCSCCPYLYFDSPIMLVTYFSKF